MHKTVRLLARLLAVTIGGTVLFAAAYVGLKVLLEPDLTRETVTELRYLNDGWNDAQRDRYYFTAQGTELLGLRYQWLVNLELPLSEQRLASAESMRGWGFIVDPGQRPKAANPGNLPVGLTQHPDPDTGEAMLDLTCALCHTGELHYEGYALRIDGGQAMQSVPTAARGEFITTLAAAAIETYINPAKWQRFADRTAGVDAKDRELLRSQFRQFLQTIWQFVRGPGAPKWYPTEEGRGRTDAVGRIANVVFGRNLGLPDNYRKADAPVSYPFLWDIWRFDWVQYTGFTNQAMARNIGESLGVLAPVALVNDAGELLPEDEFGRSTINIHGMHCIETTLRSLEPPRWPEDILGNIEITSAQRGKDLFAERCAFCHGPHPSEPYQWPVASGPGDELDNPLSSNWRWDMAGDTSDIGGEAVRVDWRQSVWALPWIETKVIGTDATAANNFMDSRYSPGALAPGGADVNAGDGLQVLLNKLVPVLYERSGIQSADIADYDGLNVPFRISNRRAYKARPLHGVWATPPFLHNGAVPTIHDLLSPHRARPSTFYVGHREYDPGKLGYVTEKQPGSFLHDTSLPGNSNTGHLFTDADVPGRIGHRLSERERADLLEYIKVLGNPDFSTALGGDPQNWSRYSRPVSHAGDHTACAGPPASAKREML
ncbi:MAG: di-heme-cytochrome C peroxidase [Pseudomonadota bacterium]